MQPASAVSPTFSEDSIAFFEDMINSRSCSESEFQRFFASHPEFLAGIDYRQAHPQLVLFSEDGRDMIPDFILEPLQSRFCDLLELKLPYEELVTRLRRGSRARFRSMVTEAVAQLSEYSRFFESAKNREVFQASYGIHAYNPRMILVIGRRHHFESDMQRQELKDLLPSRLDLWTYDDLLARARVYRPRLGSLKG